MTAPVQLSLFDVPSSPAPVAHSETKPHPPYRGMARSLQPLRSWVKHPAGRRTKRAVRLWALQEIFSVEFSRATRSTYRKQPS